MSQANVEIVRSLQPDPGADLAAFFRDEAIWLTAREGLANALDPDCESAIVMPGEGEVADRRTYRLHHGQLIVYANALGRAFPASWAAFGL